MKQLDISAIIPVYNAASTLQICLDSLKKQNIKVREIIMVDNKSQDNSLEVIKKYQKENKDFPIKVLIQKETKSVASSYNLGLKHARGKYILVMHSDSRLPTEREIEELTEPLIKSTDVVATYPYVLHPEKIWQSYNFWEKCQFARVVGVKKHGMNAKFDCYRKGAILQAGGFNEGDFNTEIGGEDWDFRYRMNKEGNLAPTDAKVEHLHYLKSDYTLLHLINKRKHVARTYGRLLKVYGFKLGWKGIIAFTTKPALAIASLVPQLSPFVIPLLIIFSFVYTKKMFTTRATLLNPRILLLPFLNIFLVYYEAFWSMGTFLFYKK